MFFFEMIILPCICLHRQLRELFPAQYIHSVRFVFYRKSDWKKLQVPITHINHCHLIDHEEQLYPIILSHCRYSLKAGQGQEVQYDFPALEKHILKRFIFGKPTILLDIPQVIGLLTNNYSSEAVSYLLMLNLQVSYRRDVYASVTFQRVREVIRQVHKQPYHHFKLGKLHTIVLHF